MIRRVTPNPSRPEASSAAGIGLVVASAVTTQTGAAFAVQLFDRVGAGGAVLLRLLGAALILLLVFRPRVRGLTGADVGVLLGFGVSLGVMNISFYQAIARIPLGVGVTIELLGPLVLSVVLARRPAGWLLAGLAFAGVALMSGVGASTEPLDPLGVLFAFGAAGMWALYVMMSRQAGARFPGGDGLALAMCIGAGLALPLGLSSGGAGLLEPGVLAWGAVVAVLSSALPYALDLAALRRLAPATFSVLLSLSPAVAAR